MPQQSKVLSQLQSRIARRSAVISKTEEYLKETSIETSCHRYYVQKLRWEEYNHLKELRKQQKLDKVSYARHIWWAALKPENTL